MTFPRWFPMVSVALGAGMGHKVVVAGGGSSGVRDARRAQHMAVEVFDSEIGTWESYGDLPKEFRDYDLWVSMSGVVLDNKFYVLPLFCEDIKFKIHFLDFSTKQWASIELEMPMDLYNSNIMAIGTTLVVAALCRSETNKLDSMKLWKVDLEALSLTQIGLMPRKWATLLKTDPKYLPTLRYLVDENLVYVCINGWRLIVAEVSLEECKTYWRQLPAVPVLNFGVDRFITFFASISSA